MLKLFKNGDRKCAVVAQNDNGLVAIFMRRAKLEAETVASDFFPSNGWEYFQFDNQKALDIMKKLAADFGASDRVLAYLEEIQLEINGETPDSLASIFGNDDGSIPGDDILIDGAADGGSEDPTQVAQVAMSDGEKVESSAQAGQVVTPEAPVTPAQNAGSTETDRVAQLAAPACHAAPGSTEVSDSALPNALSVSVSKDVINLTVGMPSRTMTPETFADKQCAVQDRPAEIAFYVALDGNRALVRSVSDSLTDRKNVASLIGNWVAEGYIVERHDLKSMAKLLRAAGKHSAE